MLLLWFWIPLGALALLALYQQFRIYQIHRESKRKEELFQIVTENAADMIALVDVSGRRLYNSPAYKRILGYSPAELARHPRSSKSIPTIAFGFLRRQERRGTRASENGWNTASNTRMAAGGCWSRWRARFGTTKAKSRSW
jgi:PAS domain-containing protein